MKKFVLPFLLGIAFALVSIGVLISPWWHWFTSPTKNAHCLPIEYPEYPIDNESYANDYSEPFVPHVFRTETSLKIIKDFYDTNLLHSSDWDSDEEGYWRRSEVRSGEFLYECYGGLNWEEVETGCIYLRERDGKTIVERIWLYSASAGQLCEWYMSELPE